VTQIAGHLPCKCEALNPNFITAKKLSTKAKRTGDVAQEVECLPKKF
jgi:hypothetical protein